MATLTNATNISLALLRREEFYSSRLRRPTIMGSSFHSISMSRRYLLKRLYRLLSGLTLLMGALRNLDLLGIFLRAKELNPIS